MRAWRFPLARLPYDATIAIRRHRSGRDPGVAGVDRLRDAGPGPGAGAFSAREAGGLHAPLRRLFAVQAEHGLPQYDFEGAGARLSGRPLARAAQRGVHALERNGHGGAGEPRKFRVRRPHRDLRLRGHPVRGGLQPLLARAQRHPSRRHGVHAGAFQPRNLRPCVSRRPARREAAAALPPGGGWRRPVVLSASVADAGILAVSHRVDGAGADGGDLSGAVRALSRTPRHRSADRSQGLGISRGRRDGRAGIDGRAHHARAREARQPDLRHQLQPAAARRASAPAGT